MSTAEAQGHDHARSPWRPCPGTRAHRVGRWLGALVALLLTPALLSPTVAGAAEDASQGPQELWMLGAINDTRAKNGLPRVQSSQSLSRSARKYAQFLADNNAEGHDADGSDAYARSSAQGWPEQYVEEIVTPGYAPGALASWMQSPPHRGAILRPDAGPAGMGYADGKFVVLFGGPCPAGSDGAPHPGCELTGSLGNSDLDIWRIIAASVPADEAEFIYGDHCKDMRDPKPAQCSKKAAASQRSPRMTLSTTKAGNVVTFRVSTLRAAVGTVKVKAFLSGKNAGGRTVTATAQVTRRISGGRIERVYRARLGPGYWKLTATFTGRGEWMSTQRTGGVGVS